MNSQKLRVLFLILEVTIGLLATLTVMAFFDSANWLCFLTCQFRVQYAIVLVLLSVPILCYRRTSFLAVAITAIAMNIFAIAPNSFETHRIDGNGPVLRVLLANINYKNRQYSRLAEYAEHVNADVLILEEFTPEWNQNLTKMPLAKSYPYHVEAVRSDTFGIAIWSRKPFVNARQLRLAGYDWPAIVCQLEFDNGPLDIVAAHFMGPMTRDGWAQQSSQMSFLGAQNELTSHSLVVAGDLNTTPWTTCFRKLAAALHLRDSRNGFGLQDTWPSDEPIIVLHSLGLEFTPQLCGLNKIVALPLDHCLLSNDLTTVKRQVGPFIGSDHFPVIVDIKRQTAPKGNTAL